MVRHNISLLNRYTTALHGGSPIRLLVQRGIGYNGPRPKGRWKEVNIVRGTWAKGSKEETEGGTSVCRQSTTVEVGLGKVVAEVEGCKAR